MSSGEAKRVLIARALVHKPRALLFDEPCNSLDIPAQHGLRETCARWPTRASESFWSLMKFPTLFPEIERVVLMSNGRIVADGPKEEVLQSQRLGKLFGLKSNSVAATVITTFGEVIEELPEARSRISEVKTYCDDIVTARPHLCNLTSNL